MIRLLSSLLLGTLSVSLFAASPEDLAWERKIVAACLILEAADQGVPGMQAVASVIANRAGGEPSRYIDMVKKPYAFSAMNFSTTGKGADRSYAPLVSRASKDTNWANALALVEELYAGKLADNTFGADHYSRRDELPSWSHGMRATTVIGDHLFFKSH